jgi:hypothetical protein
VVKFKIVKNRITNREIYALQQAAQALDVKKMIDVLQPFVDIDLWDVTPGEMHVIMEEISRVSKQVDSEARYNYKEGFDSDGHGDSDDEEGEEGEGA